MVQTLNECVSEGLELDKKNVDLDNQVKKKEAEYNIWGGEDGEKYIQDMIQFYYKIIAILIILIVVLVLFFIIYSEYILYGTIASILLFLILIMLYIYRPSRKI
jgi:ABC-type transport system involved in cytochrome bd biosynthesis fused ATPase/permease subunit